MEKDGWLDQILLGVLNLLNQPWLAITVALVGGFAVAYLARLSPKDDWTFIKEGPGKVLTAAFILLGVAKSGPRLVLPQTTFVCDDVAGPFGVAAKSNCRWVSEGTVHAVYDYTVVDFVREFLLGLAQDAVIGGLAAALGFLAGTLVLRRRKASQ